MPQTEAQRRYQQTERGRAKNREYVRAWRERQGDSYREKERIRVRERVRRVNYGCTPEMFDALLASQDGKCAVCGGLPSRKQTWHVDHDHDTGKIRGILCHSCNAVLGWSRESREILALAAEYLIKHGK